MPLEHCLSRSHELAITLHPTRRTEVVTSLLHTNSNVHRLSAHTVHVQTSKITRKIRNKPENTQEPAKKISLQWKQKATARSSAVPGIPKNGLANTHHNKPTQQKQQPYTQLNHCQIKQVNARTVYKQLFTQTPQSKRMLHGHPPTAADEALRRTHPLDG